MTKRVAVTGGSGNIGGAIIGELQQSGWHVVNFDRVKSPLPRIQTIDVNTASFGDLVSCLRGFDAIVHLAAISSPGRESNIRMFHVNVQSTFNVLEAASLLGINRVVLASSLNAVGMAFNLQPCVEYLPIDESHPCRPDEPYGISKLVGETVADGFARRFPEMTISSLRFPVVMTADMYRRHNPDADYWCRCLWAYADAREVARAARLALEAKWQGHEVFIISADHTASATPTRELAARFHPTIPIKGDLKDHAALLSSAKAERLLGWRHERDFSASLREFHVSTTAPKS